jgi:hypothetical protein
VGARYGGMTNKLLALSLLSLAAACTTSNDHVSTTDTPPPPTTEMKAVATFPSMTGSTIEIYAVGEHGYFATELADVGMLHVLDGATAGRMNTSELYMALTGNTDVPKALVELDRQIRPVGTEAVARTTGTTSSPLPQKPVASAGNCTARFFQANDCPGSAGTGDNYDWCILNWTGGRYAYASTVDISEAHLCSSQGEVLWQIQNGDGGFHQLSVLEGQFFGYALHDSDETWLHYDVLQASGDIFQFGGYFDWY